MQLDGKNKTTKAKTLFQPILRHAVAIGLLATTVFLSPGFAGAQPAITCPDNPNLNNPPTILNPLHQTPATQCVVPSIALCAAKCGAGWFVADASVPAGGGAATFCNAGNLARNCCWDSLDDAVNYEGTGAGEPGRVIAVFGDTVAAPVGPIVETTGVPGAAGVTHSLDGVAPQCNTQAGRENVVIDRNAAGQAGCGVVAALYPLQIQECHEAKIRPGAPGIPVIDIVAAAGQVTINGIDVAGAGPGVPGIRVQNFATTLKAIRAHNNGVGTLVTGGFNVINGSTFYSNINGGLMLNHMSFFNTVVNTNRAKLNGGNGFVDDGAGNLWRGNIAELNFLNGFFVSPTGAFNTFRDNRSNKNGANGFQIAVPVPPGAGDHLLEKNRAEQNRQRGFDILAGANLIGTSKGGNIARNNGGDGINVVGAGNTLTNNTATGNAGGAVCPGPPLPHSVNGHAGGGPGNIIVGVGNVVGAGNATTRDGRPITAAPGLPRCWD